MVNPAQRSAYIKVTEKTELILVNPQMQFIKDIMAFRICDYYLSILMFEEMKIQHIGQQLAKQRCQNAIVMFILVF